MKVRDVVDGITWGMYDQENEMKPENIEFNRTGQTYS